MSRPLLITDCDEVLLHMLVHFRDWLDEAHDMAFAFDAPGFREAVRHKADGAVVPEARLWELLDGFFESEMHRQNIVPGAVAALQRIGEEADIVILTNIGDTFQANRVAQLERFDIRHRILCNRGGKGRPVAELIAEMAPSAALFVDDLAIHHDSVAAEAPQVWRLHMIAEAEVARHMKPARNAHARIDDWETATPWILERLAQGPA